MSKPDRTRVKLVVCVKNDDFPAALEPRKIYCALADRAAAAHGLLRVIDESGEDYLYPAGYFALCPLPRRLREALFHRQRPGHPSTRCKMRPATPASGAI